MSQRKLPQVYKTKLRRVDFEEPRTVPRVVLLMYKKYQRYERIKRFGKFSKSVKVISIEFLLRKK